jgi:hypothetical protein
MAQVEGLPAGGHPSEEPAGAAAPQVLFSLLDELERLGVRVWVHGGWAIDALTGTSRPHKDIDLLAEEAARPLLHEHFRATLIDERVHRVKFRYGGVDVEVTLFRKTRRGKLVTVNPRIIIAWAPGAFGERTAALAGRPIPVVDVGVLYVEVANTVRKKADMLEKNARDLERLAPLLTDELCREARRYFPVPNTRWNRLRLKLGLI